MPEVKLALSRVLRRMTSGPRSSGGRTVRVPATKGIREAELETLLQSPDEVGDDQPDGWFFARTVADSDQASRRSPRSISRVVKVHRLREVIVQVGFTRFESAVPDVNGELDAGRRTGRTCR